MANSNLHLHTVYSPNDGTISAEPLREAAEAMGCKAVFVTDHGNMMAEKEFMAVFAGSPVKLIPGVEAYIGPEHDGTKRIKKMHLVLLPVDNIGLKEIELAVSEAALKPDVDGNSIMTQSMLEAHFGPEAKGHGHVIALSACIGGVIASVINANAHILEKIGDWEKKCEALGNIADLPLLRESLDKALKEKEARTAKISELKLKANKKLTKLEKAVKAAEGGLAYEETLAEYNLALKNREEAAKELEAENARAKSDKDLIALLRLQIKPLADVEKKYNSYMENITALRAEIRSDDELYNDAVDEAFRYWDLFGPDCFYLELQYHGIEAESRIYPQIARMALEFNIPVVASNDVHTLTNSPDEIKKRKLLQSLRYEDSFFPVEPGDDELYLKNDDELAQSLLKIIPPELVVQAIDNKEMIADRCNISVVAEQHYPKYPCPDGVSADQVLYEKILAGIERRFPGRKGWTEVYKQRAAYEFKIIKQMGVVDYLLIVADFLEYGRLIGKVDLNDERFLADPYNLDLVAELGKGRVGMSIGPGRGSGVGSLVNYLIGITDVDPLHYDLLFERFLNPERVTMPDIDSDMSPETRGWIVNYVKNKYGVNAVCNILTYGTRAAKKAVRDAARLVGIRDTNDAKNYAALASQLAAIVPKVPGAVLNDCKDEFERKFGGNPTAIEIWKMACLLEGTIANLGVHAAGVVIADNGDVKQYLPIMLSKDGSLVTQCDMNYVEPAGLLKMDFLGLKNLSIITETLVAILKNSGKAIDVKDIPLDDEFTYKTIFRAGNTDNVFQFESPGMKNVLKRFKPTCMEHLILLNAIYRPGPLQYIDDVIAVRSGEKKAEYIIPEMESVLGSTFGKPIYQEQIMQIFNKFAGFSMGESDIIRRYMSKKKREKFEAYKDKFISGLVARGAAADRAEGFWNELVEFSRYAFNKSHATAYAEIAYYTAYLKAHYTKEYLAAILNYADYEQYGGIISDANRMGVTVKAPDVNFGNARFESEADAECIRFGLGNIKSVASGADTVCANAPFTSVADFKNRASAEMGTLTALILSGAMDKLPLHDGEEPLDETVALRRQHILAAADIKLKVDKETGEQKISIETDMDAYEVEKTYIGAFLSGYPLDAFLARDRVDSVTVENNRYQITCVVSSFRTTVTKLGTKMAMGTISDKSGDISFVCFPAVFDKVSDKLCKNAIITVTGKSQIDKYKAEKKAVKEKEENSANNDVENADETPPLQLIIESVSDPIPIPAVFGIMEKDFPSSLNDLKNLAAEGGAGRPLKICGLDGSRTDAGFRIYADAMDDYKVAKLLFPLPNE